MEKIVKKNNYLSNAFQKDTHAMYDFLVVGCGLSGSVMAERLATKGFKILAIDKRNHIGGNCYDYINNHEIRICKYGAHLFHTNEEEVWKYVNRFSEWSRWDHRVLADIDNNLVPVPVNINTVNKLCGENLYCEQEMDTWLSKNQIKFDNIINSEQMARSRVGDKLYNSIFKDYTIKQWKKHPAQLDSSVLARIPVRNNFDDRYFSDKYQALPKKGYTSFISNILKHPNIKVKLNTDYFDLDVIDWKEIIFTGPIDSYITDCGKLEYRSLMFEEEHHKTKGYYQENSVINYPSLNHPYTRIVEYKHFLNQKSSYTTIVKEYPSDLGDPYYPVPSPKNQDLYQKIKKKSEKDKNVHFLGRLANYKYFNMDQTIKNSLIYFEKKFK
jgi:UDP-galactopyranose mutase